MARRLVRAGARACAVRDNDNDFRWTVARAEFRPTISGSCAAQLTNYGRAFDTFRRRFWHIVYRPPWDLKCVKNNLQLSQMDPRDARVALCSDSVTSTSLFRNSQCQCIATDTLRLWLSFQFCFWLYCIAGSTVNKFDFTADLTGTGNRSEKVIKWYRLFIIVYIDDADFLNFFRGVRHLRP